MQLPLILIDFLSVPLEINDLRSRRRMDSIARSVGVMKALIEMLGILDSLDLLDRTDVTSEALMRLTRIGRGLSPSGLNLPKRVQSQIDWSDKAEDNEFRILEVLDMSFAKRSWCFVPLGCSWTP